ncbi:Tn3 family transposase (plasmid) [Klebsiella variicola subsp. variicola]|nr:Tn3 family transposase [Klebsiella variicola]
MIRQYSGYHDFGDFPWSFRLKRLLYVRVWLSNERPGLMFDFATAWLLQHKVLLPAASTLTRLIGEIRERANRRLWRKLASLPDSWQTAQLAGLLEIPEGQRVSVMEQLRKGPATVSGPSFTEALERYTRLRNMEVSRLNFSGLPAAQLRNLARYAGMTSTRYNTDETALRTTIFKIVPPAKMTESVDKVNELARPHNTNFQDEMVEQYGRVKRFLPALLRDLHFHAAPDGEHTLAAIHYLGELNGSKKRILDDAPGHIITGPWKRLVYDAEGRIQRAGYSLCLLERLQDALRRRDIWLENSERWGDPRQKLLQGKEWMAQRVPVCRALGHPTDGKKAVEQLANQLDETWKAVSERFHSNDAVGICHEGKYPSLTISSLEKLDEPPSLTQLSSQVRQLLPPVDLTELLLEIDARTGFTREFIHVSESEARAKDLHVTLCAVLLAEACNIGHEPLIKHNIPALTRHRLSWVKQNYLRAETLVSANARLVDFQSTLELAGRWGGGEVASADGMRFVTPVKTLNAGPNRKYFGSGRGISWYNFISDQYSGFHGIVIPGTLRDSIFVLEGLLEQQTGLNPVEIMTDTAGASDIIFGLFWLLGYQFSPRLADAGEAVFWRIDKNAHYGALDELARGCVELPRIESHWDEMMRASGSLKLGTIHASELVRSLLRSTRPSGLAQAIMEVGQSTD